MLNFENHFRPQGNQKTDGNSYIYNDLLSKDDRFSNPYDSGIYKQNQNSNSILSNNPSIEKYSSIKAEPTLDYFNDSKRQERSSEEYYPFGRPGGGAPFRDENGQIISKKPKNQFTPNTDPVVNKPPGSKPHANWTFDDHKALRDQQKDDWRKSLLEQVQEKERLKKEEKEKILRLEREEEEKISNQLHELEKKYKDEIRGEQGLPPEPQKYVEKFERKPRNKNNNKIPENINDNFKESPQPLVKEIDFIQNQKPKAKVYEFNPLKIEYWQAKSDLAVQHNSFKNVIAKLRYDADQAHLERNEAMMELDKFRDALRIRLVDTEIKSQQKGLYQYNYSLLGNYKSYQANLQKKIENESFYQQKVLDSESKFVPLVSAGHSVVHTASSENRNKYDEIDSIDVKNQLADLDLLLYSTNTSV